MNRFPEVGETWRMKGDKPDPWNGAYTRYEIVSTKPGWIRIQPDYANGVPRGVTVEAFLHCYEPDEPLRDMQAEYVETANRG